MKTFKELTGIIPGNIMIVDALNTAFSFRGKTNYCDKYISMIESLKRSYKAEKVIIACDEGSSTYRTNIFPGYKSARKEKRDNQTEQEREEFQAFFSEFLKSLDIIKDVGEYPIFKFYGCEADDIAAYVVKKRKKKNNIWLISTDRDWDLLVDTNVSRFSYVTRKEITKDNWSEHYEYAIDDHISIKCLTNDTSDSVPGVPGIGPVKARALVTTYGTAYDIISSLPISSKYKYIANLNAFGAENIMRNYKLMDLVTYCEDALGVDNCKQIDKILGEYLDKE